MQASSQVAEQLLSAKTRLVMSAWNSATHNGRSVLGVFAPAYKEIRVLDESEQMSRHFS